MKISLRRLTKKHSARHSAQAPPPSGVCSLPPPLSLPPPPAAWGCHGVYVCMLGEGGDFSQEMKPRLQSTCHTTSTDATVINERTTGTKDLKPARHSYYSSLSCSPFPRSLLSRHCPDRLPHSEDAPHTTTNSVAPK